MMKKLYILTLTGLMVSGLSAQMSISQSTPSKNVFGGSAPATTNSSIDSRAVIWQDDFSVPANWTIANEVGNADNWVIGTTPPTGTFPIAVIASTTAANGFALFDSDLMCSGNQIGNLTNVTPINLSANPAVILEFQQHYRRYVDSTFVYVSNNGTTWTKFPVNAPMVNNESTTNPDIVTLNITSVAGGQATVWIRFTFYSPTAMGPQQGCAYSWMIDDVKISDAAANNLVLGDVFYGEYSKIPVGQQLPISFSGFVTNFGGAPQTNVTFGANVNTVLFGGSTPVASLAVGATDSLGITPAFTPGVVGSYVFDMGVVQTEVESTPLDNVKSATIEVTNNIFSRDNDFYTGAGNWNGAGNAYEMGNLFEISTNTSATGISFVLHGSSVAGTSVLVKLYQVGATLDSLEVGISNNYTILAADIPTANGANPPEVTLAFAGGPASLVPGAYLAVLVHDGVADIALANGTDIVQPIQTSFVYDTPASTWYYMTSTPMVRLNVSNSVGIDEEAAKGIHMYNYPNPATESTTISFEIKESAKVNLYLTDLSGKRVFTANLGNFNAGKNTYILNTSNFASGVYSYTLDVDGILITRSMIINK